MSASDRIDNFVFGVALSNHATYLGSNWEAESSCLDKTAAYIVGIPEHAFYLIYKVGVVVSFFFADIVFIFDYLWKWATNHEEEILTQRKIRLYVGLLIVGEAAIGLCVDTFGMVCPPAAYYMHVTLKENITKRCFEKWGIVEHDAPPEAFDPLNYWSMTWP